MCRVRRVFSTTESLTVFRRPALLAAASTFLVLSSILIYVAIENQPSGTPEQTIGPTVQNAPVFPPWFEYSLVGAWSISFLVLIVLYFRSRKPKSNVPYPETTGSPV